MSYQRERDGFLSTVSVECAAQDNWTNTAENAARRLLSYGQTYHRFQLDFCNGHRDPETNPDDARYEQQKERLIRQACSELGKGFAPIFGGDPRGATLKITLPSGRTNDFVSEGWCVPVRVR